ncbi:aminotransferase class V-fold PLP-dependent enzyme [Patiriisocius hiemis]|uniref:Aminotransferase class V-fold PLP-dependent enzyme n=1 Tax=Patiriisocius hiemis TaxID=3075604 RepID=A0ABU2YCH3_9FLAO|nr:aminotransferase class V-fold PLP-dependent enzyme [Constantimarinum sp. W242]MDT0555886.1 aminotransferase class V-fold PLP-dependent enzyme [Constantimarinum sp. W242]
MREDFPVLEKYTYLNTASCGLLSNSLVQWRRRQDEQLLEGGSVFRDKHKEHLSSIRKTVATFFGAGIRETALVPNFSFGLNTFIESLGKKQKVLLLTNEYPSVSWAFLTKDFEVCYALITQDLENNIEQAVEKHRPTIFAFSLVQYLNGIKIDIDFLKRLKAYHPDLLLVADGTQYLGTEVFNFSESPLDALGCSAYKWLISGYGNGFFLVKESLHNKLHPTTIGFNSAETFDTRREDVSFIKHFEPGHQDTLNYGSLEQSLLKLNELGMETISSKLKELINYSKEAFTEKGLLEDSILHRDNHSSIFNIKGDASVFQKLKENNIICSLRGSGIRVSMHYYNTKEDLDKLLSLV